MTVLVVNGVRQMVEADPDMPLLWALRDRLGLMGSKPSCGIGACGACIVHLDGAPVRGCVTPLAAAAGKEVTTIEGLAADPHHPLLRAWLAEDVSQCGYCQPGQIMAAAALLAAHPQPTDLDIDAAMAHVLCRCGTYQRIRRAIHRAAGSADMPPVPAPPPISATAFQFDPWIRIDEHGTVTILIDRAEMGQGVLTGLAMLVAEELEVDLSAVRTEFAPAGPAYINPLLGKQSTGGSTAVRAAWEPLRRAGAQARERLITAAARIWSVEAASCRAAHGAVLHPSSGRRLDYGALAARAAALPAPTQVVLKPPTAFRLIGQPTPMLDAPLKITGRAVFGVDVQVPGMRVAVVLRCPSFGGRAVSVDVRAAEAVPGVQRIVPIASGIAVIADDFWAAKQGREALAVQWEAGPLAALDSAAIRTALAAAARDPGTPVRDDGQLDAAFAQAGRRLEAVYETPYLAHAAMEPMNCTAHVRADGCDVWVPTQAQGGAQETVAELTGLSPAAIRVHSTFLGGGFGRRLQQDFVAEAVQLSRAVDAPMQVVWTREDDLRHDHYRPANHNYLAAALDAHGRPLAWLHRVTGPAASLDGAHFPYAIPHVRVEHTEADPGVPTGAWRSVAHSQSAFAIEGFVDELATAAGADPYAFRLDLLHHAPRHQRVLELAAERAGWGRALPSGHGRGTAVHQSFGSWVAQVAEVSVAGDGRVRVHRIVCAVDCGLAVNPNAVAAQMEGAVAFGLSAALKGEITLTHGRVLQGNFDDYPILRMDEMPLVEVHILPSREPPGGVGEPGVPPVAPAVANAVFAATGRRIRRLPIRAETLRTTS
ncbi:molybdopterin-dependent oxidoreductase [Thermithiobacillus tepidarius DSM 3134]|uniref:molybdopterin-dependent oxidoreductase n=1 Tax=Thermithiobacillus tepidarius TaxID=929 RepID=UPI000570E70C|nr:molybdopterin-dependent oxidoreductase [Thermithiobacillus tepidarius]